MRWGAAAPLTRGDSVALALLYMAQSPDRQERDRMAALHAYAAKDSMAIVGTTFTHAFRAKNKLGGLVLDSARFIVGPSGTASLVR